LDNLFDLDSDPEVMRFLTGGKPTLPGGYREVHWGFLGWFEFRPRESDGTDEVELGYRLPRSAWGKDYATECFRE
jgi:hypothetical protein